MARDRSLLQDVTQRGEMVGTPCYLAPELFDGRAPNERADIYALGVILYECLTGRRPFRGSSAAEVGREVVRGRVAPVHALVPRVSSRLEAVCLRAMNHDPAKRHPTASDLVADLEDFLAQDPVETHSGVDPLVLVSVGTTAVSILAVAVVGLVLWSTSGAATARAPEPALDPPPDPVSSKTQPTPAPPPPTSDPISQSRWATWQDAMSEGDRWFSQGDYERAAKVFGEATAEFPDQPIPHLARGHALLGLGEYRAAVSSLRRGLQLDPGWPRAKVDLRSFFGPRFPDRLRHLEQQVRAAPQSRELSFLLGYCYHFSGQPQAARRAFESLSRADPQDTAPRLFLRE